MYDELRGPAPFEDAVHAALDALVPDVLTTVQLRRLRMLFGVGEEPLSERHAADKEKCGRGSIRRSRDTALRNLGQPSCPRCGRPAVDKPCVRCGLAGVPKRQDWRLWLLWLLASEYAEDGGGRPNTYNMEGGAVQASGWKNVPLKGLTPVYGPGDVGVALVSLENWTDEGWQIMEPRPGTDAWETDRNARPDLLECKADGWIAFYEFVPRKENPYTGEYARAWQEGWREARANLKRAS